MVITEVEETFKENLTGDNNPHNGGEGMQPKEAQMIVGKKGTIEEEIKRYQDILIALGFTRYDNGDNGIAYKLHVGPLQIGRTFTTVMPIGNMWAKYLVDCEHGKKGGFMKRGDIKLIPQVDLFYKIREGELPIPEPNITGKIVGKSEKAVQIQFSEFNQIRTEWWGFGALKRSQEGITYVPASYSKETEKYHAKMQVPRDILLSDYEVELKNVPLSVSGGDVGHTEQLVESVEKQTLAEVIQPTEPVLSVEKEKLTVDYYVQLIGEITEKVKAEERISKGEWGYAINMVFHAYTKDTRTELIAELKGGVKDNEK